RGPSDAYGQARLQHEPLAQPGARIEIQRAPDDALVVTVETRGAGGIDERRLDVVEEVVARRSRDGPAFWNPPPLAADLPRPDGIPPVGPPLEGRVGQTLEVPRRIEQSVGMIDPEAVDPAALKPFEHARMVGAEHVGVFLMERYQLVDVEEAAIVDLARGPSP